MYKIQKTETLKKKPNKVRVFFDDFSHVISIDTFAYYALYEGKEIDKPYLENILLHDLRSNLQEKVMNYITYMPRTEFQVREYIRKYFKKFNLETGIDELLEEIIQNFREYGYLNDEEYAKTFIKSRLKNKPKSRYFLFMELSSKGIEKDLANKMLDMLMPDSFEILKKVYEKKFKDQSITIDDKKKISFLQRKGFSWDDISNLINEKNEV